MKRLFTKYWIRPYAVSDTAKMLALLLNGKRLRIEGSRYNKKNGHVLINWGSSAPLPGVDLNKPEAVSIAVSKLQTFRVLNAAAVPTARWTTIAEEARSWLNLEGVKVIGRDVDNGRAGRGITVYRKGDVVSEHEFYTAYFKKQREFRIHVFKDEVIFEQEKKKKKGAEEVDKYVRSHDRGWCFAFRHLVDNPTPDIVRQSAIDAVRAIGLDFGAVDCGWNDNDGACVFEVNTAPGLEQSSLEAYANAISQG